MKRRLNYYRFYVRIAAYLLPLLAFSIAGDILSAYGLPGSSAGVDPYSYFSLLLFTSVTWAIAAEYHKVSSIQELFHERTGIKAASAACTATFR